MHGLVRCKHEHRCSCVRGGCIIHRCQNKTPDRNRDQGVWVTSCTGSVGWGFWGFEKKQWVEFLPLNERVEIQSWARPDEFVCYGCSALVGLRADDIKAVSIERLSLSLSLSSYRITFKLKKVNKSFVPEPISCFWIPIYVYEHFMNIMSISHIHIMGMLQ